jgi:hypothetical protein
MCFLLGCLFLFHLLRHPLQRQARLPDLALRLVSLLAIHFGQRYVQPPAGALHTGGDCLQIALQRGRLGDRRRRWLSLRFQKQLRRGEDALAHQT